MLIFVDNGIIYFCKQTGQFWIPYGLLFQYCDDKFYKKLLHINKKLASRQDIFLTKMLSCLIKAISVLKPCVREDRQSFPND